MDQRRRSFCGIDPRDLRHLPRAHDLRGVCGRSRRARRQGEAPARARDRRRNGRRHARVVAEAFARRALYTRPTSTGDARPRGNADRRSRASSGSRRTRSPSPIRTKTSTRCSASSVSCSFPTRVAGYREAKRVLKSGGWLHFNVWDRIEANDFAKLVIDAATAVFPDEPPNFLARTAARLRRQEEDPCRTARGRVLERPRLER